MQRLEKKKIVREYVLGEDKEGKVVEEKYSKGEEQSKAKEIITKKKKTKDKQRKGSH